MKQLEPILKYHFWILLGIGLILAFTGWWMTTGQMKAAINTRKDAIEKAVKMIPSGEVPSKDWEAKLKAINEQQKRLVDQTRDQLYARQKEKMVWPEVIREVAATLPYRGEFKNTVHHLNYRDNYMTEVMRVYSIPRPITPTNPEGVVVFPLSVMPHRVWGDAIPSSKQMWDSMEDLWLLEPILQAILEVNGGASASRYDASILAIELLKLRGGDRSKIGKSAGGGGGTGGMPTGGGDMMGAAFRPPMAGSMADDDKDWAGAGRMGGGGGGGGLDADDNLIFGDPGAGEAGGGGAPGGMPAGPPAGFGVGAAEMRPNMADKDFGPGNLNSNEETGRRYIDDDKAMPYRTRGFKLIVVMDHRKIPELYAQLTSSERSPWPIQILQMHVGRLSDAGGLQSGLAMGGAIGPGGIGPAGNAAGTFGTSGIGPAGIGAAGFGAMAGAARAGMNRREKDEDEPSGLGGLGNRLFGGATAYGGLGGDAGSMADMMDNPFLARVIVWGLITLYNEPEAKPAATPETQPSVTNADGAPSETADGAADSDDATETADESRGSGTEEEAMSDNESDESPAPASDDAEEEMEAPAETSPSMDEDASDDSEPTENGAASSEPEPNEKAKDE
jgi:hypothetical protein